MGRCGGFLVAAALFVSIACSESNPGGSGNDDGGAAGGMAGTTAGGGTSGHDGGAAGEPAGAGGEPGGSAGEGGSGGEPDCDASLVYTGDFAATRQGELAALRSYVGIDGTLTLSGDVANLSPLRCLTSITGNLEMFEANELVDLGGLERLRSIGGDLNLQHCFLVPDDEDEDGYDERCRGNASIQSTSGLQSLTEIGGSADFRMNLALRDFDGLENLTTVGGDFLMLRNEAIASIDGLRSLTEVGGTLRIETTVIPRPWIRDLNALANLTTVGGDFTLITRTFALDGLRSLRRVGGTLDLYFNDSIESLEGLDSLTEVGGLSVQGSDLLADLHGLEGLDSVPGTLTVRGNAGLSDLTGLETIASAGSLVVADNSGLASLNGLRVEGELTLLSIFRNDALTNLDGLEGITSVGSLELGYCRTTETEEGKPRRTCQGNALLVNTGGLRNLTGVGDLSVATNPLLLDLNGLSSLREVGGDLLVVNNPMLPTCEIDAFLATLTGGVAGSTTVEGNDAGGTCEP